MDDDYWNIDGARDLSDSWTGFTRFTLLEENPPDGYTWSGVRLTKKQTTSRPDGLWPENMSEAAQRKEKHKWAIEKPKLDNARRLRGIYFTDPADEEFTETIENAQRKLEVPMQECLARSGEESTGNLVALPMFERQNMLALLRPEADESMRRRLKGIPQRYHEDHHIAAKGINSLWSISGDLIYRHHVEPPVKRYVPREDSFPVPLKYIDVSRTTRTNLDVMQERRIDDYWNIDGSRDLSDPWTGFTQFALLEEKPPDGYMWCGGRLTKRQATSRPYHLWPELWRGLARNAKLKEKHKWSNEKPKLDNARRLRGIYFIDPEDKEFKETIRNARKKLETPMATAMPCKTCKKSKHGEIRSKTNDFKSEIACILEARESTRLRMEETLPNHHEDHIARKGNNSLQHYNLVHKFIPMPQAMKIPAAKAAVDKEWEILKRFRRGT